MLLRRARAVVASLFATGCLCGAFTLSAAADPGSTPTLQLVSQSAAVVPSAPGAPVPFNISVRVKGTLPAGAAIRLTFYDRLGSRSAFEESLSSAPSGIMQRVASAPIGATGTTGATIPLSVTIVAGAAEPSGSNTVGLTRCRAGDDSCSGVYPVVVELLGADGSVVSHLSTFLTYVEKRSPGPIVFSWVAPIAAPVRVHLGLGSSAVGPLKPSRVRDLAQLMNILAKNPTVQVSVAASPATLEALGADSSANARATLAELRGFAAANPRRLLLQPYVPVNLASLSEAGLTTEIQGQTVRANAVTGASSVLGGLPSADQPTASKVWLAQGSVSPSIGEGLNKIGAVDLVLPDSDLPSATEEDHATWSQPFFLATGRGNVIAAAADTQLSSYFAADPGDPVLAANHLLAALAMIHFELPGAPDTRGVIAVPPPGWDPDPAFVSTLVAGLASNPVVTTATLDQFFGAVPMGGNEAAGTRHLLPGTGSAPISASQAAAIATARKQIDGFAQAVKHSQPPVENQLEDLLLASESSELSTGEQRAALDAFERQLSNQLRGISVVTNTVTLTARTATVPITIVSSVGYRLDATLTLQSAKLQFPQGSSRSVKIDHPTNTTDVQVRARTTGDLPLAFSLTSASPGGTLIIERGQLTVRSTATSIVGIVLTLVAAVVLLGWWARTWRRGRRLRAARSPRGTAS